MSAEVMRIRSIRRVLREFLEWRIPTLDPEVHECYRGTLACFEGSIDAHAGRSLAGADKRIFRSHYIPGRGYRRRFTEVFGPEKIPSEIGYFLKNFLYRGDATREILESAPAVVADLCSWLVFKEYVPEEALEDVIDDLGAEANESSVSF